MTSGTPAGTSLLTLLAALRVSVMCAVACAAGSTEYAEREAFTRMGRENIEACCALRERLERVLDGDTRATNERARADEVLAADQYDDRLRAFGRHQHAVLAKIESQLAEAPGGALDRETRALLHRLRETHRVHAQWIAARAAQFAASRDWEYRSPDTTAAGALALREGPSSPVRTPGAPDALVAPPPPAEPVAYALGGNLSARSTVATEATRGRRDAPARGLADDTRDAGQ